MQNSCVHFIVIIPGLYIFNQNQAEDLNCFFSFSVMQFVNLYGYKKHWRQYEMLSRWSLSCIYWHHCQQPSHYFIPKIQGWKVKGRILSSVFIYVSCSICKSSCSESQRGFLLGQITGSVRTATVYLHRGIAGKVTRCTQSLVILLKWRYMLWLLSYIIVTSGADIHE